MYYMGDNMKPYIFLLLTMALLTFVATASCYGEDGTAGNVTVDSTASLEVKNERPRLENHLNRSYYLDNYSELLSEALAKNRAIRTLSTVSTEKRVINATTGLR